MLFDIISIICIFAIICLCAVLIESRRENHMLSVSHYTITDKRIKKSATFAMIADLHNAEFGDKNEDLIKEIKKIAPDAVLIAGDVIVGKKDVRPSVAIDLLQKLGSEFPVYISKGNHEMRTGLYTEQYGDIWECLYEQTKDYAHWLINEEATLASDNIQIVGLDIDAAYYRRFRLQKMETDYLVKLLPTRHQDAYTILLAHNPDYFPVYAEWGADLVLSGHVHGGMVILPVLGGVVSPMVRLFPKYYRGMYECRNKKMILTGGLGGHTLKFRVNNKPEICVIHLEGE